MSGSDSSGIKNQFEPGHFVRNITSGIVEAYAQCQRKAFFLLQGKIEGREHEYFQILKERATANRLRFEASPEVGLKDIVDKKNDAPHVVKSGDMVADCDALLKSESGHLTLKTHAQYEPCLAKEHIVCQKSKGYDLHLPGMWRTRRHNFDRRAASLSLWMAKNIG